MSFQDFTFPTRIQDGIPRDHQRDEKGNCLTIRKTLAFFIGFYAILSGSLFFHQDPGWDPKGQPKAIKKGKCSTAKKNHCNFLLDFTRSLQDLTFSTRIQDGIPRAAKWNKKDNAWQVENPCKLLLNFTNSFQDLTFFHQDPGWDPKGTTKGTKKETARQSEKP